MSRLYELAARMSYPGVSFEINEEAGRPFLRVVSTEAKCNVSGKPMVWAGRKWRLSPHMTDMEVVNTGFLALLTAHEHEAREQFKVDGIALMDSHRDLDQVLDFMGTGGGGHGRIPQPEPRCADCGRTRNNHPFRHPFVGR